MIPDIIFSNKQNIEWKDVESYLEKSMLAKLLR